MSICAEAWDQLFFILQCDFFGRDMFTVEETTVLASLSGSDVPSIAMWDVPSLTAAVYSRTGGLR